MNQVPWLVVGLGNPGTAYADTRHNVGANALAGWVGRMGGALTQHKRARADVHEGRIGPPGQAGPRLVAARPRSYMNESGGPVAGLLGFYKVPTSQLVVVHDELDLPLGGLRLKFGGGDNGHNGLRSIRASLGTGDFYRVRIGIGRPPGRMDPATYVLRPFAPAERLEVELVCAEAADAVELLLTCGLDRAQSQFNR